MSIFDEINGFRETENEEKPTVESVLDSLDDIPDDELVTEAVYPSDLKKLMIRNVKINLPKGEPNGRGWMIFLYTPSFESSLKIINNKENMVPGQWYRYYYYMMQYKGTIYNRRYNIRNYNLRKNHFTKIRQVTSVQPYMSEKIPAKETRNMYFDLHTYLEIFQKYAYRMPIPRRISTYWEYLKPIYLKIAPQYKKMVIINLEDYDSLGKKLRDNLDNPIYMMYYTLFKYPGLLKDINLDFVFYLKKKTLRVNPSELTEEDIPTFRVQMQRLLRSVPKEALDHKLTEAESILTVVEDETKSKLGLVDKPTEDNVVKDDTDESKTIEPVKSEMEKTVEETIYRSSGDILTNPRLTEDTIVNQSSKVKAVVQMQVDSEINEDRKLLEDAYNKIKHEKVPTNPRSSARDQLLKENQKKLVVGGMTVEQLSELKAKEIKVKPKGISKAVQTPNTHMTKLSFCGRNNTYLEQLMPKDITDAILALNTKSIPIYVRDIKIEDTSDELNYKDTYTISLEDTNRQRHTVKVDIPKVVENRFLYLGGGKKNIKNQEYFFPVVKLNEDEVQLVSNYNKMTIRRQDTKSISAVERLKRLLKQDPSLEKFVSFGNSNSLNKTGEFITTVEYDELAKILKRFKCGDLKLDFSQHSIRDKMEEKKISPKDGYMCVGFKADKPIFIKTTGSQRTDDGDSITDLIIDSLPEEAKALYLKLRSPKRLMYANVKVMKQFISVAMLLGFWEGLETLLKKCHATYRLENHMPKEVKASENVIRFADTFLVYEDTMEAGLILNGIRMVNTEQWNLTDFNSREPYMDYFSKVYGKSVIANALMNFYEWFIDPITEEILKDIDLPTNIVDLVIYADQLSADSQHTSLLNQKIVRVRNFEIIPMVLYGELARQYVSYRNSNGKRKFTIPRDAVIKSLLGVTTVEEISTLNPTLELETTHGVSFKGFHGMNLDDSYTIAARSYDKSMTGIVAPSSPPDAGVGLNRMLSLEPKITNLRGYAKVSENDKEINELEDVNLFSPGELTMPGAATIDDPSRLGHAIKQSKHVIPVNDADPVLVSNGMEEITRFDLSSDFVVNADEAGEVVEINDDLHLIVVKYNSGKYRAINTGTNIVKNSGGGFYLNNQLITDLKVGDKFKKDDVLAYHENFFTNSKYNNCRMNMGTLTRVGILSGYNTYEDATFITEDLSERCGTKITEIKQAVIGKNANILHMAKEGQEINVGDTLIAYDTSYDDSDLNTLLDTLGDDESMKNLVREGSRNLIRSKFGGKIISIKMYSTVDLEELSPSLQKIFKSYYKKIKDRKALLEKYDENAKDSIMKCGILFTETTKKIEPNKYGNIRGQNVEDSVMIEFYIEELEPLEVASKIANYSGLKNTIGEIIPRGYEPYAEWRPEDKLGTIIAENSILKRMTPSILEVGFANKLIVGFKEHLREIYEKE